MVIILIFDNVVKNSHKILLREQILTNLDYTSINFLLFKAFKGSTILLDINL